MVGAAFCGFSASSIRVARADGAFPDAQAVLLPRDRPSQIIVATTFGLVFSDDDGATWSYACENPAATQSGFQYSMGPPPQDRIFAVSASGVPVSADSGCTWRVGAGALAGTVATDVFPDPTNAARAFAIALPAAPAAPVSSVFRSLDGGATYGSAILTAPPDFTITGIESAASAPMTVYATLAKLAGETESALARSDDGGDTWSIRDSTPQLGAVTSRLIAVDPADARRVFLRLISGPGVVPAAEAIVMTTDGGLSFTRSLELPGGNFLGFARLSDGVLFAAGATDAAGQAIYRSDDGGATFVAMPVDFHPRGLAARNGVLFVAAADLAGDGFALASSADGGKSWRPRLSYANITGVRTCVRALCQVDCDYLAGVGLFSPSTCAGKPAPNPAARSGGCAVEGAGGVSGLALMAAVSLAAILFWINRQGRH